MPKYAFHILTPKTFQYKFPDKTSIDNSVKLISRQNLPKLDKINLIYVRVSSVSSYAQKMKLG